MTETLVLYHGGCRDGFCSAWVVFKYFHKITNVTDSLGWPQIQFIPAYYGQEPPDCKGKDVIIVDFCYDVKIMEQIVADCKSLIWLDHHKTADSTRIQFETGKYDDGILCDKLDFIFNLEKSGAGLAWDYFFPETETTISPRPWLVDYVEDRDLWKHQLYESHKINALIACLEFDFKIWDYYNQIDYPASPGHELIAYGKIAQLKTEQYIREVCKNIYFADIHEPTKDLQKILDDKTNKWKNIPIVNIPQVDCSEVMEHLLKLYPKSQFSLYWFKRQDGQYQYGMRSRQSEDFDVSQIAKLFGGGGHKNAAGFQLNYLLEELK